MLREIGRNRGQTRIGFYSRWVLPFCLCASSIMVGCVSNLPMEPTSPPMSETPTTPTSPSPSPTPDVDLEVIEQYWFDSAYGSALELVGIIINRGEDSLEDVQITLEFPSLDGSGIESFMTTSTPGTITPDAEAMVHFILPGSEAPEDYSLIFSGAESETITPAQVDVDILEYRQIPEGGLVILGEAHNGSDHLLHIKQIKLLLFDHEGEPLQIATSEHLLPALAPGDRDPFVAYAETSAIPEAWKAFIEASPDLLPSPPPLTFKLEPEPEQTAQGHPFYLGQIENQGVTPWWAQIIVLYSIEDKIVGMDTLRLPIPIPSKERIPILLEPLNALPSNLLMDESQDDFQLQYILDPWASIPSLVEPIPVPVSITQFEQIGSRLYVQGQISNPQDTRLSHAGILIRLLDLRGNVRSTAWNDPLEGIDPGHVRTFASNMPLPKDLDLSLVEFDIRGFGFPAE